MLSFLFVLLTFFLVSCQNFTFDPRLKPRECKNSVWYRPNILTQTDVQWNRFVEAVKMIHGDKDVLKKRIAVETHKDRKKYLQYLHDYQGYSRYDQIVLIHIQNYPKYHQTNLFLPWHRAYIQLFERELLRVDPLVTLPYWDFTIHHENLHLDPALAPKRFGGRGNPHKNYIIQGSFQRPP